MIRFGWGDPADRDALGRLLEAHHLALAPHLERERGRSSDSRRPERPGLRAFRQHDMRGLDNE